VTASVPQRAVVPVPVAVAGELARLGAAGARRAQLAGEPVTSEVLDLIELLAAIGRHGVADWWPEWLPVSVAASMLGRSPRTLRRWAAQGRVRARRDQEGARWQVQLPRPGEPLARPPRSATTT
jgi:hypothetical protein